MTSTAQIYQKEMHNRRGFFATWLPGERLDLGDVGVIEDGRFRHVGSLRELDIRVKATPPSTPQTVRFNSTSQMSCKSTASATAPGVASTDITVSFDSSGSFVFHALELRSSRLDDRIQLAKDILAAYERGKWKPEWFLIDTVQEAACATILIANGESAEMVLSASASVGGGEIFLADPKLGLKVSSTKGIVEQVIAGKGVRPLYSCLKVSDSWFSGPSVKPVRGQSMDAVFERVPLKALKYA